MAWNPVRISSFPSVRLRLLIGGLLFFSSLHGRAEECARQAEFQPSVGSVALTSLVGATSGALSYAGWVLLHEGSHAVAIEAFGGDVTQFDWIPRRMEGGRIRFAAVYSNDPHGRIDQHEDAVISLAPNITGLAAGTVGTALWLTNHLPEDRLVRTAFATFQIGASINGGINGVVSRNPALDVEKATRSLGLNSSESTLLRAGLMTFAIVNLAPAADSLYYGLTGHSVLDRVHEASKTDPSAIKIRPMLMPNGIGVSGTF